MSFICNSESLFPVVCAEADSLPGVLKDLNIALSSFGENPTDQDLADLVSCAAHQTLTVFSQVYFMRRTCVFFCFLTTKSQATFANKHKYFSEV